MKPLVYKKAKRIRRKPPARHRLRITRGDTVQVISGDDKGKQGRVLQVFPKTGRIKIPGIYDKVRPVSETELNGFLNSGFDTAEFKRAHGLKCLRMEDPAEVTQPIPRSR